MYTGGLYGCLSALTHPCIYPGKSSRGTLQHQQFIQPNKRLLKYATLKDQNAVDYILNIENQLSFAPWIRRTKEALWFSCHCHQSQQCGTGSGDGK